MRLNLRGLGLVVAACSCLLMNGVQSARGAPDGSSPHAHPQQCVVAQYAKLLEFRRGFSKVSADAAEKLYANEKERILSDDALKAARL